MKQLLEKIRQGGYANVLNSKAQNVEILQLRYNPIRHKFYLSQNKRGLMRRNITKKEAERLLKITLSL